MSGKSKSLGGKFSKKHTIIAKDNRSLIIVASLAATLVALTLVAGNALINIMSYQNKVISLRSEAVKMLDKNLEAIPVIYNSYEGFNNSPESIIGTQDTNSKIVLDSLPSKYDFPALISSIEFVIKGSGMTVDSITGTDQEVSAINTSPKPEPQEIPFEIKATGSYDSAKKLIADLQRSIRPMNISSITIEASNPGSVSLSIVGVTYYQPTKEIKIDNLKVTKEGKLSESKDSSSSTSTTTSNTDTEGTD